MYISKRLNCYNQDGNFFLFTLYLLVGPYCKKSTGTANNKNFTRTLIGITDSFEVCVMSRGGGIDANGFTWDMKSRECFAINDAIFINDRETYSQSCIFDGITLYIPLINSNVDLVL